MVRWINNTTEIRPLRVINRKLMVDAPALTVDGALPIDISLDRIKLLLIFS